MGLWCGILNYGKLLSPIWRPPCLKHPQAAPNPFVSCRALFSERQCAPPSPHCSSCSSLSSLSAAARPPAMSPGARSCTVSVPKPAKKRNQRLLGFAQPAVEKRKKAPQKSELNQKKRTIDKTPPDVGKWKYYIKGVF